MKRLRTLCRLLVVAMIAAIHMATVAAATTNGLPDYPPVTAGRTLQFPADTGAHPEFRTEWWYLTGWLRTDAGAPLGFQITFFRSRPPLDERDPSRFAPKELLFAHVALADPATGHLLHDQRAARAGFGLAQAATGHTRVHIGDWALVRESDGSYHGRVAARDFALDLQFRPTQSILLQGDAGYSRKGPQSAQSSYYYSEPQLAVTGTVQRAGRATPVTGTAWLDHEWSSEILSTNAVGWDWTGINLQDGGAVMAFRIRNAAGEPLWAGGSWRTRDGHVTTFGPADITFEPVRWWRSARTGVRYPVAMRLRAGPLDLQLEPLMDDQELDSRASTGAIYWEGAITAQHATDHVAGHGYLELTGYFEPLGF